MSLALSSADVRNLETALTTLASPFDHDDIAGWRAASRHAVAALVGADKSGSLYPFGGEPPIQVDPEDAGAASAYAAYYNRMDTGLLQRRREMGLEVSHWSQLYDLHSLVRSEIYNDWSRPSGFLDAIALTVDFPGEAIPAGLLFYHAREDSPEFGERGLALLRLLLPAFKAGVHHCSRFTRSCSSIVALITQSSDSMIVVDVTGRVLHENASMARLLDGHPEAARVRHEAVRVATTLLRHHAWRKSERGLGETPGVPTSELRTGMGRYVLRAVFLPEYLFGAAEAACVTIEPVTRRLPTLHDARRVFRLTQREAEVAFLLARGLSNRDIATELDLSPHTALRHTEHVLEKLGLHSRAAVAATLAGIA